MRKKTSTFKKNITNLSDPNLLNGSVHMSVCMYIYILQYIFLPSFLTILYQLKYINTLVKQLLL